MLTPPPLISWRDPTRSLATALPPPPPLLLLLLLAAATLPVGSQNPYCDIDLAHTLCQFRGLSATCGQPASRGFNESEKDTLVGLHNRLRSTVASGRERRGRGGRGGGQPAAANMMMVRWDDELAAVAQRWADQCRFAHDQARDVRRFSVGQNIFLTSSSGVGNQGLADTIREGIIGLNGWYSEVAQFDSGGIDRYRFESGTGHYTQLVWAETEFVGCGQTTFSRDGGLTRLLVCNYGPAGNFVGESVYIRARPCTMCPFRSRCLREEEGAGDKTEGLCVHAGEEDSSPAVPAATAAAAADIPVTFFPSTATSAPTTATTTAATTTTTTTAPRVVTMPPRRRPTPTPNPANNATQSTRQLLADLLRLV